MKNLIDLFRDIFKEKNISDIVCIILVLLYFAFAFFICIFFICNDFIITRLIGGFMLAFLVYALCLLDFK